MMLTSSTDASSFRGFECTTHRSNHFKPTVRPQGPTPKLEDICAGIEPVDRTGDFTDVTIVDANGREIPWPEVSRIGQEEMGRLMRQAVNRLYTFQAKADDLHFQAMMDQALVEARRWGQPELDEIILSAIASTRRRTEEGTDNAS